MRVHQALVAGLALVEPRIHRGGILERGLQPAGDGLELGGLLRQHFAAFARGEQVVQQISQRDRQKRAETERRDDGQMAEQQDVAQRRHKHDAGDAAENDANDPRKHLRCSTGC